MRLTIPKTVNVVELENAPFKCAKDADACASFVDFPCRVKTTLKRFLDNNFPSKAYSYEISNIEILKGTAAPVARPSDKISMDVSILLNGVCDVNGAPLLEVCEIEDAANGS